MLWMETIETSLANSDLRRRYLATAMVEAAWDRSGWLGRVGSDSVFLSAAVRIAGTSGAFGAIRGEGWQPLAVAAG